MFPALSPALGLQQVPQAFKCIIGLQPSARCVARALSGEILWNLITYNLILCVCLSPYLQFDPHDNSESPSQMKRLRFRVVR